MNESNAAAVSGDSVVERVHDALQMIEDQAQGANALIAAALLKRLNQVELISTIPTLPREYLDWYGTLSIKLTLLTYGVSQ